MPDDDLVKLAARLRSDSLREREAAVDALIALGQTPNAPYDAILELLHERFNWGRDLEPDRGLRDTLHTAIRRVAIARAKRRGLRLPLPAELDDNQIDEKRVVWASIGLVWDAASIYEGLDVLEASLAWATPEQRGVYAIWWTNSEVCNGGFSQYFANATGIVWPYAVEGLRQIGAYAVESIVRRAGALFPAGKPPADQAARRRALDDVDLAALSALDDAYYAAYPAELFGRAASFVRANRAAFFE